MKFYGWGYDPIRFVYFKESHHRVSLAVQCLRICLLVLGCSSIPDQRTKILHVSGQLSPHATTNTQHSEKKKKKKNDTRVLSLFGIGSFCLCLLLSFMRRYNEKAGICKPGIESHQNPTMLEPRSQTSRLQKCEKMNFC